jgi:hypothetical protein
MKTKPTRPLTPAQIQARLAAHKLSWVCLLQDKLDKLSFPSLTQGTDKFTEGKRVAGALSIMRHYDPKVKIPADMAARLEKAILERDTKFLNDFRKASKTQTPLRGVYSWMLGNYPRIEACHSKGAIVRLVKKHLPKIHFDERRFYKTLAAVGLPLSKPREIRTP